MDRRTFLCTLSGGLLTASLAIPGRGKIRPTTRAAALSATSSVDSRIRLDWEVGTRRGRPVIQEYVYNDCLHSAYYVRLQVETLDASDAVAKRTFGFVRGAVSFNDRSYFEMPLKRKRGRLGRVAADAPPVRPRGRGRLLEATPSALPLRRARLLAT